MKRTEAIEQLQNCIDLIKQDGQDYLDERDFPLLDMAIEALQREDRFLKSMDTNEPLYTEVVRCKDCKHWASAEDYDCEIHSGAFGAEDFCSYGERKGGDDE